MPDEAVQMQQIGEVLAEQPAPGHSSYLGQVIGRAWARLTAAGPRRQQSPRPDGLEAFDMLGGWKGSDARQRAP